MGIFNYWQGSKCVMQVLIIKLVSWLGWFCYIAVGHDLELRETLTGSVSFPDGGITCIGNLAVFVTSLLRGRLDLEMGARDVLATLRGPKLTDINGFGLSTTSSYGDASVVMLSNHTPNYSIKQFMKYISSAHRVESILLRCYTLETAKVTTATCNCRGTCDCIVFSAVEEIIIMLALRMPGTIKRLPDSQFLLPSLHCLRSGCHECDQRLLHVETDQSGNKSLTEVEREVEAPGAAPGAAPAAVCEMLRLYIFGRSIKHERLCICIPVHPPANDRWTQLLFRFFMSKDKKARGPRLVASDAMENYIAQNEGHSQKIVEYSTASLLIPRFTEVLINLALTGWFRVDGFSSALLARRTVSDYVVDSKGHGFAANAFLTKALVKSNYDNTNVCQVLMFRGTLLSLTTLSFIVGCVNLICSISWAVLTAFEGGAGKVYHMHSMPLSKTRVAVIMVAVGIGLVMDCFYLYFRKVDRSNRRRFRGIMCYVVWALISLEILCIISGCAVFGILGLKGFGRWLYSALQGLVWLKWGTGSYLLGEYSPEYFGASGREILVYSSAFLLNSILAGVQGKWEY